MSLEQRRHARPIGTYALVALEAQNAGYGAVPGAIRCVVMCDEETTAGHAPCSPAVFSADAEVMRARD
jgi:hypothetical protein